MQRKDGLPKTPVSGERVCVDCAKPFPFTSNVQKRCAKCQKKLLEVKAHTKPCPICGTMFYAIKNYEPVVTCSIACRNKLNRSKQTNTIPDLPEMACVQCAKQFKPKSGHAKYCSPTCQSKARYQRNIDYYKEHDRIKITKQRIGLNIRDAHQNLPTRDAKWLWDGVGMWSRKYPDIDACLECNTSVYKHLANGVCAKCYDKLKAVDEEKRKATVREWYTRTGGSKSYHEAKQWVRLAKDAEIPVTPKIANLLENFDKLKKKA